MGFSAYTSQVVVQQLGRSILSLCAWNQQLLVGLSDGSLLFLEEQPAVGADAPAVSGSWQVVKVQKGFAKHGVLQLLVVDEGLLSLTDVGVTLHSLPDLLLMSTASHTARASTFAWCPNQRHLATALRKKIVTHQWKEGALSEMTEYTLPDLVACLAWAGNNLVVGTVKHYHLIVPQPPQQMEFLPGQSLVMYPSVEPQLLVSASPPLGPCLAPCPGPQGQLLISRERYTYFVSQDGKIHHRGLAAPLAWRSPPAGLLVSSPLYVVALLESGVAVQSWGACVVPVQELPLGRMKVHAPSPSPDGRLFLSAGTSEGSITALVPVPLEQQAQQLAADGDFGAALELSGQLEEGGAKQVLQDQLRTQYAYHLFAGGEYDEALTQLSMVRSSGPLALLGLFPSLVPEKFRAELPAVPLVPPEGTKAAAGAAAGAAPAGAAADAEAISTVIPYLLSYRTRALAQLQDATAAAAGTAGGAAGMNGTSHQKPTAAAGVAGTGSSSSSSAQQQNSSRRRSRSKSPQKGGSGAAAGGGVASPVKAAGHTLPSSINLKKPASRFAALQQQQQQQQPSKGLLVTSDQLQVAGPHGVAAPSTPSQTPPPSAAAAAPPSPPAAASPPAGHNTSTGRPAATGTDSTNHDSSSSSSIQKLQHLLTILDTALLKAMLQQPDTGAVLKFVQTPNFVDLDEGESALSQCGRYAELAALYQYNKDHAKGLALLQQLSQHPEQLPVAVTGAAADLKGLPGVWAAVRYLVSMKPPDVDLIREHAAWVLEADAEAGLEAFVHMQPMLPPAVVLPSLRAHAPDYCAVYLETCLERRAADPKEVHSELLLIYLNMALEEEREGEESAARHAQSLALSTLLLQRPAYPLKLFPDDKALWGSPRRRTGPAAGGGNGAAAGGRVGGARGVTGPVTGRPRRPVNSWRRLSDPKVTPPRTPAAGDAGSTAGTQAGSTTTAAGAAAGAAVPAVRLVGAAPASATAASSSSSASTKKGASSTSEPTADDAAAAAEGVAASTSAAADGKQQQQQLESQGSVDSDGSAAAVAAGGSSPVGRSKPAALERLKELVYKSPFIDPDYVLSQLPPDSLLEIRALMLERLNRHSEALRLYVHGLHNLALAEAYCDRVYDAALEDLGAAGQQAGAWGVPRGKSGIPEGDYVLRYGANASDIYMELLEALVDKKLPTKPQGKQQQGSATKPATTPAPSSSSSSSSSPVDWADIALLMARKVDRINSYQVLKEITDAAPLADVGPLLAAMLQHSLELSRNLAVVRNLCKYENLTASEELVNIKLGRVVLTAERACCLCHKRIGSSVLVVYPSGSLAHYVCHQRNGLGGPLEQHA